MGLIDRLTAEDNTKISAHGFSAALFLHALGKLTRKHIVDGFALSTQDQIQLDLVRAQANVDADGPLLYAKRVEAVLILAEEGKITKSQVAALLDL